MYDTTMKIFKLHDFINKKKGNQLVSENNYIKIVKNIKELEFRIQNLERSVNLQAKIINSLNLLILRINFYDFKTKLKNLIIEKILALDCLIAIDNQHNFYLTPYNDKIITPSINKFGVWEKEVSLFLEKNLSESKLFVNIGANFGYHAIQQAQNHPNLRIIAVEPHYKTFMLLKTNCELNNVQIEIFNLAISNTNGRVDIYESDFNGGNNKLEYFDNSLKVGEVNSLTIETFLMDQKVDQGLFLIDMQGLEIETVVSIFQLLHEKIICIFELDIDLNNKTHQYYKDLIEKIPHNVSFSILDSMGNLSESSRKEFIEELLNSSNKDLIAVARN